MVRTCLCCRVQPPFIAGSTLLSLLLREAPNTYILPREAPICRLLHALFRKGSFYDNMDSEPSLRWGGYRSQYSIDQEVFGSCEEHFVST